MSEHQTYPELMALAQAIAEELTVLDEPVLAGGPGNREWTALSAFSHLAYVQAGDGRRFSIRAANGWRFEMGDRLEISGSYPKKEGNYGYISNYDNPPQIGVTSSRPPKALAKDIKRRFLPRFHEFWELAMERKRQHEEHLATQERNARLIAEAFDAEIGRDHERVHIRGASRGKPWGHIDVSGSGTVTIELRSVPVDIAVKIGELLT